MTAPIPPHPFEPGARLGVAEGHEEGYGRFLVATGPYMVEGAERLDFSRPPAQQAPAAGYQPGKSLTLVRNPSWDRSTDPLRPAYPDRIVILNQPGIDEAAAAVDAATIDLVLDSSAPPDQMRRYDASAALSERIHRDSSDVTGAVTMNLAVPPFDDVHVRRALNLVVDKAGLQRMFGQEPLAYFGYAHGDVATHVAPDAVQGGLLQDYDPYATAGHRGDLKLARAEMAQSRYDHDGDGVCDDPVCRNIRFGLWKDCLHEEMAELVRHNAAGIGIDLELELYADAASTYETVLDPANGVPATLGLGWTKDFPNGGSFFFSPFHGSGLGGGRLSVNHSLVGATTDQLRDWGYSVTSVPSIDAKLEQCLTLTGRDQLACWAQTDELLMEEVVPWVPFYSGIRVAVVSDRIAAYAFDQAFASPALDGIALRPGSG